MEGNAQQSNHAYFVGNALYACYTIHAFHHIINITQSIKPTPTTDHPYCLIRIKRNVGTECNGGTHSTERVIRVPYIGFFVIMFIQCYNKPNKKTNQRTG